MIHLNTREFSYHKDSLTFTAEASTLEGEHPGFFNHDVIELQSQNTGACKTFKYEQKWTDNEGDTLYWTFKSDDGLLIKVFND